MKEDGFGEKESDFGEKEDGLEGTLVVDLLSESQDLSCFWGMFYPKRRGRHWLERELEEGGRGLLNEVVVLGCLNCFGEEDGERL